MDRLLPFFAAAVGIPALLIGYLALVERFLRRLSHRQQRRLRPWFWLTPACLFLFVFLVYPMLNTLVLSLFNAKGAQFAGLANYSYLFTNADMLSAIKNNLLWVLIFVPVTVVLGLLMAVLTDRVAYERVAKAILFLPMAISFVAAGVIWKFMYDYRPPGSPQTGTLNALWTSLIPGAQPQAWLVSPATNNGALIFAGVWMSVGFCVVILSAGLKSIPTDLVEAARVDGASERQALIHITVPMLWPTIGVVTTTMMINALKVFDIVYVLTNGNYHTDVIATQMYKELFIGQNFGHASAIAVVLLAIMLPVMILNIRNFRQQETLQ